jgi:LPXTG-motif cell wall-anchored protein
MDAWVIANPTAPLLREIKTNDTTTALIIISLFGISSIAGYYFFIKKKRFKL